MLYYIDVLKGLLSKMDPEAVKVTSLDMQNPERSILNQSDNLVSRFAARRASTSCIQ